MSIHKPNVNDVFTPTGSFQSNKEMYIPRAKIEGELRDALGAQGKHILIHGDSGYGKTWLYQHIFDELKKKYVLIDSNNILNGFDVAVENILSHKGVARLSGSTNQIGGNLRIIEGTRSKDYENYPPGLFEQLLKEMQKDKETVLIFDNLEHIMNNDELVAQLLSIISSDLPNRYSIKLLFIGVQVYEKLKERISQLNSNVYQSTMRRLASIHVDARLDLNQITGFVGKGFTKLRINLFYLAIKDLSKHVYDVTLGVPHALHEYCRQFASHYTGNVAVSKSYANQKYRDWVEVLLGSSGGLIKDIAKTKAPQQHRVLYTLGLIQNDSFTSNDVKKLMQDTFPSVNTNGITSILGTWLSDEKPILKQAGSSYSFASIYYRMWIRLTLDKGEGNKVTIKYEVEE